MGKKKKVDLTHPGGREDDEQRWGGKHGSAAW